MISLTGDSHTLGGDLANDSDGDTGTGERVAHDEILVDAELTAKLTDFVLEQLAQGFDELEALAVHHAGGETADVVVGFDGGGGTLEAEGLDDVGVEGALEEVLDLAGVGGVLGGLFDSDGLLLEEVDEGAADDLALGLGLGEALEAAEEEVGAVDDGEVDAEVLLECLLYLLALVKTHDTVVNEDGVESVAYVMCQWTVQVNFENQTTYQ